MKITLNVSKYKLSRYIFKKGYLNVFIVLNLRIYLTLSFPVDTYRADRSIDIHEKSQKRTNEIWESVRKHEISRERVKGGKGTMQYCLIDRIDICVNL